MPMSLELLGDPQCLLGAAAHMYPLPGTLHPGSIPVAGPMGYSPGCLQGGTGTHGDKDEPGRRPQASSSSPQNIFYIYI